MEKKRAIGAIAFLLFTMMLALGTVAGADPQGERPGQWAQPILMKGVPNLHKVSEDLYRSAQPTAEGMKNLKKLGVKTIVNLRSLHSDRNLIENTGFVYEHIRMKAWHPEEADIIRFLQIMTQSERAPILVHCQHGADRTGTMVAIYRVVIQQWTKEEAVREMTEGHFGFHTVWDNLRRWIYQLDIDEIKRQAGI